MSVPKRKLRQFREHVPYSPTVLYRIFHRRVSTLIPLLLPSILVNNYPLTGRFSLGKVRSFRPKNPVSRISSRYIQEIIWRTGLFFFKSWLGFSVHGRENVPERGPYLLVANHTSHLDGPAVMAARGSHFQDVYSLGARDYFYKNRLRAWLSSHVLNMVAIDRSKLDFRAVDACRAIAQHGGCMLVFPEGTRSTDGELHPFKPGFGLIALRVGIPVVPVYIHGTYQVLPKGRIRPRRHPVHVSFGSPIDARSYYRHKIRVAYMRLAEDVYRSIDQMRKRIIGSINGTNAKMCKKFDLAQSS